MQTYERKTPEDLDCGVTVFMKVLGAKWKPCIVDLINRGYKRPSEIHKQLITATPRVVDMQLRELESYGIVAKKVHKGFPLHVDYALTDMGKSLLPVIVSMDQWGAAYSGKVKKVATGRQTSRQQSSCLAPATE
ncbi:winged helix-turn-helix transcriptional regulator [Chitinophaga ginsengisoli]|uniref:HxlR family transcriptional regulator n=1 Tax=Chitinophaga ginsengisoli TaxID=363837 RepID=A0A2P8GDH4_9BACT|nr:helix-turn-helix domain-containing protein [Chitinophaga ginsengisoli]PSL32039.1 HxlR family transcriptional regulator [Chitinophaga ginsengisoli]